MADMSISQSAGTDGTVHLALAGEIDMASSSTLAAALRAAICADDTKQVAVDLGQVTFLDSSGMRELVLAHALAAERAVSFYIINAHERPRRVLELTGLLAILTEQAPPDAATTA